MSLFDDASLVMIPIAYKDGKLYSIKPTDGSGDFTFSRSTAATRVNADGLIESVTDNVPRLDYTDSSCPALKLEPQRTNLIEYKAFDNAYWTKTGSSVVSGFASPSADSPLGAFKLVEDSSSGIHRVKADGISVSANRYNVSVFVKPNGRNEIRVSLANYFSSGTDAYFNLDTKVITYGTRAENGLIETFANGWFRCSFSSTSGELAGPNAFVYIDTALSNSNSYQGDGTSGVYIYGAQLEQGSYATSYIPTYGTSVTRNADACSKTGVSDLIGQTEGTIFIEFDAEEDAPQNMNLINFNNSTQASVLIAKRTSGELRAQVFAGGSALVDINSAIVSGKTKAAIAYKSGDSVLYVNGVGVSDSSTFTFNGTLSDVIFLSHQAYFNYGHKYSVNQALLFKTRLSNEELADLTTL
jgi:hypothetical protein